MTVPLASFPGPTLDLERILRDHEAFEQMREKVLTLAPFLEWHNSCLQGDFWWYLLYHYEGHRTYHELICVLAHEEAGMRRSRLAYWLPPQLKDQGLTLPLIEFEIENLARALRVPALTKPLSEFPQFPLL